MLSSIVMALIFGCVLLLLVGLGLWVLRRHRRSRRAETASSRSLVVACEEQQVSVVLPVQEAMLVPFEKAQPLPGFILPPSWYRRWRMLVSLGLLLMLGLAWQAREGLYATPSAL